MKKFIISGIVILTMILACESDDICIDEISPYFIIRFYDADDPVFNKKVLNIKVELGGIDGFYEDDGKTITEFTDSIAIPIKVTEDITKFKITVLQSDELGNLVENEDVFDLTYTRENFFVSRSCGYKTLFYDAVTHLKNDEDNWIKLIVPTADPLNIDKQDAAHVEIYH